MRLIDADALIQDLIDKGISFNADVNEAILNAREIGGYADCVDRVWEIAYERGMEEALQWIPCSERLPEANGRYFVTRGLNACGSLWNRTYIANYSGLMGLKSERIWWQGNVGKTDFEHIDDVIAWMPLPQPYIGDEE